MTAKEKYITYSGQDHYIPLFNQPFWLDITCGKDNWDVVVEEEGEIFKGAWTYYLRKSRLFTSISMPMLTPAMGLWLNDKLYLQSSSKLTFEKDVMSALLDKLPPTDSFEQKLAPQYDNWLPMYWKGFQQTTRYTYVLDDLTDETALWRNLSENVRRNVNKAKKTLVVEHSNDIEALYRLNTLTFDRQEMENPISPGILKKLDAACGERNCKQILFAKDTAGNLHAGVFIVWDTRRAYYLVGGGDPQFRTSGAMSLLLWEAIRLTAPFVKIFDFEGSMIEPIELFVRKFGSRQAPYFLITRRSKKFDRYQKLKSLLSFR